MHYHVNNRTGASVKEWELLWALFTTQDPYQQELLCTELVQLPAARINRYLLEYVYLAVSRPSGPLERVITELCGRSFNTALQVSWLLLALLEDQPGNMHIQHFKDACERAALTGGEPHHPHYLRAFAQQQQYQEHSPCSSSPAAAATPATGSAPTAAEAEATSAAMEAVATAQIPSHSAAVVAPGRSSTSTSSTAASPFAFTAVNAFSSSSRPSSPCKSPSAMPALAGSTGSLSGSHRFRDSLDSELMKHASQDLASAASRTPSGLQQQGCASSTQKQGKQQQHTSRSTTNPEKHHYEHNQQQEVRQQANQLAVAGIPNGLASIHTNIRSSRQHSSRGGISPCIKGWAVPGSVAAGYNCFEEYLAEREAQLMAELGPGQGVSQLMAASYEVAMRNAALGAGWIVTHEEELMSTSMLLEMPPRSPRHAAGRDSYLATLDFVEALCETSSSLTRFPPADRRKVLRRCLGRINQEVMDAAEHGVAVRYPVGGCRSCVLRLLAHDAVILNSRDKAPFLLMLEVQDDANFVDEVLPEARNGISKGIISASPARSPGAVTPRSGQRPGAGSISTGAGNTSDVLSSSPDQQDHTTKPLRAQQQQLLQQLYQHEPQQRRPHSGHHGASAGLGMSPLSRSSTPAPASPPKPFQQQQQQTEAVAASTSSDAPTADASASAASASAASAADASIVSSERYSPATGHRSSETAAPAVTSSARSTAAAEQQLDDQLNIVLQQQPANRQQLDSAVQHGSNGSTAASHLHEPFEPPSPQAAGASALYAAAATARCAPPSRLELQMQEAAAVLRGEKLIRLHLAVVEPADGSSSGRNNSTSRVEHVTSQDDGSAIGPWVFGELPACSSSEDINKYSAHGASRQHYVAHDNLAHDKLQGNLVFVQLEVVVSAPVVQQLSLHHKTRRRLPSMEAIDIIAGKLGKADIPPPTEIGPPLQLNSEFSTSSRSSSGSIDGDVQLVAPISPAHLATVAEGAPASARTASITTDLEAPAAAAAATTPQAFAVAQSSNSSGPSVINGLSNQSANKLPVPRVAAAIADYVCQQPVGNNHRVAEASQLRDNAADVQQRHLRDVADASATAEAARSGKASRWQQQQQQVGAGWWGFLRQQRQHSGLPTAVLGDNGCLQDNQAAADTAAEAKGLSKQADTVYGEGWAARSARVRATSPFGGRPGWGLTGVIVKSGDDCRQELLALQLIRELGDIWAAAELPLWVLPFEVLVTSSGTALIQLIPDSSSVHSIKAHSAKYQSAATSTHTAEAAAGSGMLGPKKRPSAAAGGVSLSDHFFAKWKRGSPECLAAQRRFVESLAGYSLVTYLLQVKDRHNGNIMMDTQGHLIHIDYGFMLSNAPGGNWVRFEAAPMKLTREILEVMDSNSEGQTSDLFDYFKVLCIQGFLAARKERLRITSLVRIMAHCSRPGALCPTGPYGIPPSINKATSSNNGGGGGAATSIQAPSWPCFQAGADRVVAALEGRFAPQLSEGACVQHVLRLISNSLDAWSTRQYDYYQRVLNGIL